MTVDSLSKTGSIEIASPPSTPVSYIEAMLFDEKFSLSLTFKVTSILVPWLMIMLVFLLIFGVYLALFGSPDDIVQGSAVRIMYVHVPSAWIALFSYLMLAICSFFFIIWRHPLADILSRSIAPVGALFALLTLITGSIWGRPMWGTWWVWDARLTSMLILFIFFMGYIALSNAFEKNERGSRPAALLAIAGSINLPIVKFSVDWWNTLHQPASIIRTGGILSLIHI